MLRPNAPPHAESLDQRRAALRAAIAPSALDPAGNAEASPAPNKNRVIASDIALNDKPVPAVNADHQAIAPASTTREPNRSAIQPPGTWNSAYDQLNAETLHPIRILSMWNSRIMLGAAAPIAPRSIYIRKAIRKLSHKM